MCPFEIRPVNELANQIFAERNAAVAKEG